MVDEFKCKSKLKHLLSSLEYFNYGGSNMDISSDYIREFMSTKYCDKYYNLSSYRTDLSNSLGTESMIRIEQYKETTDDAIKADKVILLNRKDHKKILKSLYKI